MRKLETLFHPVTPTHRPATPRAPHPVPRFGLGYGKLRFQSAKPAWKWTSFVAGLWSGHPLTAIRALTQRLALGVALVTMAGCSQIALPDSAQPMAPQPPYVSLAAKYLQSALKDVRAYDGFEISPLRWVNTLKGWSWIACVRFHERGHARIYAIFIQGDAVSDARFAVETDTCEAQTYTQFDLISGELGRPTAPMQQPIY
jgi:hypothetical protein